MNRKSTTNRMSFLTSTEQKLLAKEDKRKAITDINWYVQNMIEQKTTEISVIYKNTF